MAHTHEHADDRRIAFLDQLCTIGTCGALGIIMILLYDVGALGTILHPKLHATVLIGGIGLLALVVARVITSWFAGREHSHSHDHPECHDHCPAAGHDHKLGWAPWRYAVVLLPVVLFFLNIPGRAEAEASEADGIPTLRFSEVESAADTEDMRAYWDARFLAGETVRLTGVFVPVANERFFLGRYKMTCCWADAVLVPMRVPIIFPKPVPAWTANRQWLSVIGKIRFMQVPGREEWRPTFQVDKEADAKKRRPDPNPMYD